MGSPSQNAGTADAIKGLSDRVAAIEKDLGMDTGVPMENFPSHMINCKDGRSFTKKYLTPEIYAQFKDVSTPGGFTFDNAIQPACDAPHLGVGCVAGDEESYACFK